MKSIRRNIYTFLAVLFLFSPLWAYQTNGNSRIICVQMDSARSKLRQAQELLEEEYYNSAANLLLEAISNYEEGIPEADTNSRLKSQIDYWLGYAYYHLSNYDKSLFYFYEMLKLDGIEPYYQAKAYNGIANVSTVRNNPHDARFFLKKVLDINRELEDNVIYLSVYNNLANTYSSMHQYDSALIYLQKAYEISFHLPDSVGPLSIMLNMANNFQMQNKLEQAEYYYRKTIDACEKMHNKYVLCQAKYGLAVMYLNHGKDGQGLDLLGQCSELSREIDDVRTEMMINNKLSGYYAGKKDFEKAYHYQQIKQSLYDSVFNMESERSINRLKTDFELYQLETTKQLLEKDLALYKNKIFRRNTNIAILSVLVLAALLYGVYLFRRLKNRNREFDTLHDQFDNLQAGIDTEKQAINEKFQSELELKHKELTTNALLLIKTEEIAGDILENVKKLKTFAPGPCKELVAEIESSAKELFAGKGWEEFKYCFEQVNSSFYENLDNQYPGLTPSDRRFAALLSLGLTTKEIAIVTNRSVRGVETSKFRLKKKMGLDTGSNLVEILEKLK